MQPKQMETLGRSRHEEHGYHLCRDAEVTISPASVTSMLHRKSRSSESDTWPATRWPFLVRRSHQQIRFLLAHRPRSHKQGPVRVQHAVFGGLADFRCEALVCSFFIQLEKALAAEALAIRRTGCLGLPNRRKHRTQGQRPEMQSTCRRPFSCWRRGYKQALTSSLGETVCARLRGERGRN